MYRDGERACVKPATNCRGPTERKREILNEEVLSEPLQMFNRSLAVRVIYGDMCYDIKLTSYIKNIASNLSSLGET